ncbi:RAMP superfamily CRISPR-associated protein [Goodfellowiella coeruleoviolacea]|uniref:CRISPR/Cas system CSM-associated protein Csm3, group 7 of RAMP superfamily n=1 Tax=Goodfellowiella coeruleoviolacea TaxID=334858 RepID=A0AAE3GMJ4_9PSEU|nr:RAMP superfamily CRISPR-associated protein [Goodfellowiella coeruleoviolacea]MCP2170355.1 CRISPR/Cas system CSM-associated protein Csm3, group 7 of RAMP superfamily [Goodfellowiella coeruleoviolacea]
MRLELTFHGPFRVSTGDARSGVAGTVNRDDLIPASSLKGLMRASAALLLPHHEDLIAEIFGGRTTTGRRHASPWHWAPVRFAEPPKIRQRARIAVDPDTGAVKPDFLALNDEVWATTGSFEIVRHRPLSTGAHARHVTVLACAAAGVHALGADRRRGLGWVSVRPVDPPMDESLLAAFEQIVAESAPTASGGSRA